LLSHEETSLALAALTKLPDPVLVLDAEMRVVLANLAAQEIFGAIDKDDRISAVIRTPSVVEAIGNVLDSAVSQMVDYSDLVPVARHYRAHIMPVESDSGAKGMPNKYAVLILHDLTEIKRSEQMRADFVANASHELRTPLASLAGFIETLRGHAREDEAAREQFLSIMQVQAERMGRLIEDLLSLSRIEMNEHVVPEGAVDLLDIAKDVVDAMAPKAREANAKLVVTCEGKPIAQDAASPHGTVIGDRDELIQVVQNLVDNAIKYGRRGGTVTVDLGPAATGQSVAENGSQKGVPATTFASDKALYVSVQDEGDGISRQDLPRLTERFYRVDVKHSREVGGTGLGLAIVKHIVNRHRGWLTIDSTLGQGSKFTVFLPAPPPV
jgi:two-component system phosphate regulon sensor histidine kinase PhoR